MLDLELDDGRLTRPTRANAPERSRAPAIKPKERRYLIAPLPESRQATEAMLHRTLAMLYEAVCSLEWGLAAELGRECADIWCALPEHVRVTLDVDFPSAPGHLSEGVSEAWIAYAVWHCIWWRREAPGINYRTGMIEG